MMHEQSFWMPKQMKATLHQILFVSVSGSSFQVINNTFLHCKLDCKVIPYISYTITRQVCIIIIKTYLGNLEKSGFLDQIFKYTLQYVLFVQSPSLNNNNSNNNKNNNNNNNNNNNFSTISNVWVNLEQFCMVLTRHMLNLFPKKCLPVKYTCVM